MAVGDYTKIVYVNGTTPAINATNLNHSEDKVDELDSWAANPTADTIAERTSAAGVTVDGLLIKDSNIGQAGGVGLAPVGSMTMYAGASVPSGWLLCDGQAVSRTTYAALFTAISTTWGIGNGSTTFNVPDMREAAPVGAGTYSAVTGTTHGTITAHDAQTLGTFADDRVQGHFHDFQAVDSSSAGSRTGTYPLAGTFSSKVAYGAGGTGYTAGGAVQGPITDGTNGTPRTGATTRGKIIGINFIIKY